MGKYLDEAGLQHYTEKMKEYIGNEKVVIGEEEGTAYDGAKGKANADFIKDIQTKPTAAKDVVTPVMTGTWTVYNAAGVEQTGMGGASVSTLERGYQAAWTGSWKWTHDDTKADPTSVSGSFGTTVPASGVSVQYPNNGKKVSVNTTISVTVSATTKGGGWTLSGGYLQPVGASAKTHSASIGVSFADRRYWGKTTTDTITEAVIKSLTGTELSNSGKSKTFSGLNLTDSENYVFAYPASYGDVSVVTHTQGGASFGVKDAFVKKQVEITNAAGAKVLYNVYCTTTPGKFKDNSTVAFS